MAWQRTRLAKRRKRRRAEVGYIKAKPKHAYCNLCTFQQCLDFRSHCTAALKLVELPMTLIDHVVHRNLGLARHGGNHLQGLRWERALPSSEPFWRRQRQGGKPAWMAALPILHSRMAMARAAALLWMVHRFLEPFRCDTSILAPLLQRGVVFKKVERLSPGVHGSLGPGQCQGRVYLHRVLIALSLLAEVCVAPAAREIPSAGVVFALANVLSLQWRCHILSPTTD